MKKAIATIFSCVFFLGVSGCVKKETKPKYTSAYTVEEHIERIEKRTEEKFARELRCDWLVDYKVDILYELYTGYPKYFLVELEYAKEWGKGTDIPCFDYYADRFFTPDDGWYMQPEEEYTTKYRHLIGIIENDGYKLCFKGYLGFVDGRSAYTVCGYGKETKKYFGGWSQAIEEKEQIVQIFRGIWINVEFESKSDNFERVILTKEKQKEILREDNIAMFTGY